MLPQLPIANRALVGADSPDALLLALVESVPSSALDRYLLLESDPEGVSFRVTASWDSQPNAASLSASAFTVETWPILRFIAGAETMVIQNVADQRLNTAERNWVIASGLQAGVLVPLRVRRVWLGLLVIGTRAPLAFTPDAIQFFEAAADVIALSLQAIKNAARLAHVESLQTGLLAYSPFAQIVTDLDGTITLWSPGATALYGYIGAEMVGQPLAQLTPGATPDQIAEQMRYTAWAERAIQRSIGRVNRDGQTRRVQTTTFPIFNAQRQVTAVAEISVLDQTADPQLDAAQKERDRLEAILDATNDAIIMFDTEQRIVTVNMQFETLFHIARYSILTTTADDLITRLRANSALPPELVKVFVKTAGDLYQTVAGDFDMRTSETRTLVWYSAPVYGHEGTILGRLFVFRDATQERQADRMKTEFVSLISHELRTPLTSIKGFSDLMADGDAGELSPNIREYVAIIQFNTQRLLSLVNDILDITRLEAGRVDLLSTRVDLRHLLPEVVAPFRPMLDEKHIVLHMTIPADLPEVWADFLRVMQIATNLVSNATKYTPDGGTVHVDARLVRSAADLPPDAPTPPTLPFVLIGVHDTGMGIAANDQVALFTRFYRTPQSIRRQTAGTGLGLYIVRSLVEVQGGRVWVSSALDKGSSFYFTLPLAE